MKALAEKSSSDRGAPCRRTSSVAGDRVPPAPARRLQRIAATGSLAATLALGSFPLATALVTASVASVALVAATPARADEPAAPPAAAPAESTPPAPNPAANLPPEEIERQAEAIARSIMSPFCPGRTVSACPVAGPWREDIRHWVAEGVDSIEIKRRLAERVPEHNLGGVPKNRLGWVLPVGLGVGALALLIFLLRRLTGPGGSGTRESAGKGAGDAAVADGSPAKPGSPAASTAASNSAVGAAAATNAAAAKGNGEDYDARLDEELETLEQ